MRGALIIFEGLDRSGKTTQSKLLSQSLKKLGLTVNNFRFPERTTDIGKMISGFLAEKKPMGNELLHLLFSANRWELKDEIESRLYKGEVVIIDRYAFSGVAYSGAKGLDVNWCKSSDKGKVFVSLEFLNW